MSTIIPYLFIADEPPSFPVLRIDSTRDGKVRAFSWEPNFIFPRNGREHRGAHVLRYDSLRKFEEDQFIVLAAQTHWKIAFGVDVRADENDEDGQEIETLEAQVEALEADKLRLVERVNLAEGGRQAAVAEVEDLQKQLAAVGDATNKDEIIGALQHDLQQAGLRLLEMEQLLEIATAPPTRELTPTEKEASDAATDAATPEPAPDGEQVPAEQSSAPAAPVVPSAS